MIHLYGRLVAWARGGATIPPLSVDPTENAREGVVSVPTSRHPGSALLLAVLLGDEHSVVAVLFSRSPNGGPDDGSTLTGRWGRLLGPPATVVH